LRSIFADWQQSLEHRFEKEGVPAAFGNASARDVAALVVAIYSGAMTLAKTEQSPAPLESATQMLSRLLRGRAIP
jgi:hypothetical protein